MAGDGHGGPRDGGSSGGPGRRPAGRQRLPRRRWWARALDVERVRSLTGGRLMIDSVEREYDSIVTHCPPWAEPSPTLRFHLRQSVAPALAVYRVLRGEGVEPAVARAEVSRLVEAQMAPALAVVSTLDRLHLPFRLLRAVNRRLVPRMFPAAGFTITWTRDDEDALEFDFTACHYLRLLRHYQAPELTGVFCHGDELAYQKMPRTVRFARAGTLANGAVRCDFTLRPADRGQPRAT